MESKKCTKQIVGFSIYSEIWWINTKKKKKKKKKKRELNGKIKDPASKVSNSFLWVWKKKQDKHNRLLYSF